MDELKLKLLSIGRTLMKYGRYIEALDKDVAILKANSHTKRDLVVCENCKCKLKEK